MNILILFLTFGMLFFAFVALIHFTLRIEPKITKKKLHNTLASEKSGPNINGLRVLARSCKRQHRELILVPVLLLLTVFQIWKGPGNVEGADATIVSIIFLCSVLFMW
jgi:hypothetical protein